MVCLPPTCSPLEIDSRTTLLPPLTRAAAAVVLACVAACGLGALAPAACADAGVPSMRIAGVLPDPGDTIERWCWSGAWVYPVGDPRALGQPERPGDDGFMVLRSVSRKGRRSVTHQGADLGNRHAGGTVRAASSGLVVRAAADGSGYGEHVVLAHRLGNGGMVYSVYAHLESGSITVRPGQIVPSGKTLGRVGRTGRASANHLHFEIRRPQDPSYRWEHAAVVDPLAFIGERLAQTADSASWAEPYLEWAEASALIERHANADTEIPLERATWWSMLARAARHSLHDLPSDVKLAKRLLAELGVVNERDPEDGRTVEWAELKRDLERLSQVGVRLPACLAMLPRSGGRSEARSASSRERGKTPTLSDACFELAELASPRGPEPPTP